MAQPAYEVTHHPVDLSRHGKNPYGMPIYRVVWADSRLTKVMHRGKVVTLPRYYHGDEKAAAGHWILEKWVPSEMLWMSREQYAAFLALFPNAAAEEFPERGDYELSLVFPSEVDEGLLNNYLEQKEANFRRMSDEERRLNVIAADEAKEKESDGVFDKKFNEAREMLCQ